MDRKKIIIISIVAVVISIILIFIAINIFSEKNTKEGVPISPQQVAKLPVGDPNASRIISPGGVEGTNKTFQDYVSGAPQISVGGKGYAKTQIRDKNQQTIPLNIFTEATGIAIYPKINEILAKDDFYLVSW